MGKKYDKVKRYIEKLNALQAALTLFEWDMETLAPSGSFERTSTIIGELSEEYYKCLTDKKLYKAIEEAEASGKCSELETKILEKLKEDIEKQKNIPAEEYREFAELTSISAAKWKEAKVKNDFDIFAPYLEKVIAYTKKFAAYARKDEACLYDVLLGDYEKGFTVERLDKFFDELKEAIVPLVQNICRRRIAPLDTFLHWQYDTKKQKEFNRFLSEYIGFEGERGVIAESEHPFTTSLHKDDVRITTHYYEDNLGSAIFSTIHETGHALFEMGNSDEVAMTPVAGGSCAVHESQSRMYENMIGRSKSFWKPIYEKLQKLFPENLEEIDLATFIMGINRTFPSLVRTEADELTYSLHIIIRYELEKELIEGNIDVKELPKLWNEKYEEYLGISPENYSEGILQDIHWSQGSIGYFPSYAVGNAIAAQIYNTMAKDIDIDKCLENGELDKVKEYLKENVHQYGMSKTADELLKDITGESFNPKYYIDYLTNKFTELYLE